MKLCKFPLLTWLRDPEKSLQSRIWTESYFLSLLKLRNFDSYILQDLQFFNGFFGTVFCLWSLHGVSRVILQKSKILKFFKNLLIFIKFDSLLENRFLVFFSEKFCPAYGSTFWFYRGTYPKSGQVSPPRKLLRRNKKLYSTLMQSRKYS